MSLQDVRRELDVREELVKDFFSIVRGSDSVIFQEGVISALISFIKNKGFPCTTGGADKGGLESNSVKSEKILKALEKSGLIEVKKIEGKLVKDSVKRSSEEDSEIRKNPDDKVDVWMLSSKFIEDLSTISDELKLGLKGGNSMSKITEAKQQLLKLRRLISSNQLDEAKKEEADGGTDREKEFFKKMDQETVEILADSLLSSLAELELAGVIPKFENSNDVRDALLASVRKMYQERGVISKLARKFDRLGANRVLRYARADINKALRK